MKISQKWGRGMQLSQKLGEGMQISQKWEDRVCKLAKISGMVRRGTRVHMQIYANVAAEPIFLPTCRARRKMDGKCC